MNAKQTMNGVTVRALDTPLGTMIASATVAGVQRLEFADVSPRAPVHDEESQAGLGHIQSLSRELKEYFDGKRDTFSVPLDLRGTDFQKTIWTHLAKVGYGRTVSYSQLAAQYGNPRAVRAIAAANASNRVLILVPCHRVIGADGGLMGYRGGVWRKRWLVEMESGVGRLVFS